MNPIRSLVALASLSLLLPTSLPAAIVAGYRFDETSGSTAADAIRGAAGDGALSNFNGAQWIPGKIGLALDFAGDNDYVFALNALPTGTTAFSISMWAWADTNKQWGSLVKNWGDNLEGSIHLGMQDFTGRLSNFLGTPVSGPIQTPSTFALGTWHHVAVTWNGATQTEVLYLDGVQVATLTTTGLSSLNALGSSMAFGVKPNNAVNGPALNCCQGYWDGRMDDLVFYNTVLTSAAVAQIKLDGDNGISAIVPEPGSALLGLAGLTGLIFRRRR